MLSQLVMPADTCLPQLAVCLCVTPTAVFVLSADPVCAAGVCDAGIVSGQGQYPGDGRR